MLRAQPIALPAVAVLGRAASGFALFALILAFAGVVPAPEPSDRARSGRDAPPSTAGIVTLNVPEGELSGTLTVVDARGRELISVTSFATGETALESWYGGGASLGAVLGPKGDAHIRLNGTERETSIDMNPDGTTATSPADRPGNPKPETIPDAAREAPQK
jgi:hypothetical protein